jgi:hypothetical protein
MIKPIEEDKLDLFEKQVLFVLKDQPPNVLGTDFTLEDRALAGLVRRSIEVYNRILAREGTITEKHVAIVSTLTSLVCEKALLEKYIEGLLKNKENKNDSNKS